MHHLLIADDHLMFGSALQYLLEQLDPSINTIATGSIGDVIELLKNGREFDLILLDYAMPQMDGIEGLKAIRAGYPNVPIGIISGNTDCRLVRKALDAGACGWIPKTMSEKPLLHALRLMAAGEKFIPAELLDDVARREAASVIFSSREREVAERVADGLSDKEIAQKLGMEPGTVQVHVRSLYKKVGAPNRTKFSIIYREKF